MLGAIESIPVWPKQPVRDALLEVKPIVDGLLATLAPLERRRLCSTRALARTLASTRRAATGWSASFQEDESQPRQSCLED